MKAARKSNKTMSSADQIVLEARKRGKTLDEQLEIVRWWRDVNGKNDFKFQFLCATAIDKLKGLY